MKGLPRFTRPELLFSAKCFAAATLALYLASSAGLPRPFWALMTTYIVAHPLASNVRSKALFRLIGTLLGCAAAIVLIPPLSGAPELLSLALALWTGLCLYLSLLDRSARSYVFMLAGYSAALIGFPVVEAPASMFDTAIARVEEIGLGILCAGLVHSIVLPVGLAPSLLGAMDRALGDARRWIGDLLASGERSAIGPGAERVAADRLRLALDITQLRLLSTHVPFDAIHVRSTAAAIAAMQDSIAALTPALVAAEDRLCALQDAEGKLADDICSALAQFSRGLDADASEDALHEARLATHAIARGPCATLWIRALRIDLAARLEELHTQWRACAALRNEIGAGLATGKSGLRRTRTFGQRVLHRDREMALRSAATAVLATCVACAIWISTGWPGGSAAAMSAAVFCSFFATMDDPVPAMRKFVAALLWSMPVSLFYVLVALPWARNFEMLMLNAAPLLLLVGCYLARPASALGALGMFFGVVGTLALHDTANADLVTFIQSNLALLMGAVVATRTTALVRSVSAHWSAQRLRRATLLDLVGLVSHPRNVSVRDAFAARMLDRIALLMPRAASRGQQAGETTARQALRELSMGADIAALQQQRAGLASENVTRLFGRLDRMLRAELAGACIDYAPLLSQIDRLLLQAVRADVPLPGTSALVGLRRNLFPTAPAALQP
ncbi:FUSC family protein [Delftia tsuruhatensis]|uniref:FUSC family protein n=1 Tax=Delftia tsuruhatensis TaxID=180282 RepID=UPI002AD44F6A|nr:FUSC family protein [Delftia tsuruhatensis]WQM85959.1 FUSC family protein [Delftia tsuruhatensis]